MFDSNNLLQNYEKKKQLGLNFRQLWITFLWYEYIINKNKEAKKVLFNEINTFIKATGEGTMTKEEKDKLVIPLIKEDIDTLLNKKVFTKLENNSDGTISMSINKELCEKLFINMDKALDELMDVFSTVQLNFKGTPLYCNNIDDIKTARQIYYDAINGSLVEHKKVIDASKYAINKGIIRSGLNKIINNKEWKSWYIEMNANNNNHNNISAIKSI